jgi:hypothetical protein
MTTTVAAKSYSILFGPLIPPYFTAPWEAAALTLYLLTPRLQGGEIAAVLQILQLPAAGVFLLIIGAFLKNLIYTRSSVDEWKATFEAERTRERAATEKAHESERAAWEKAYANLFEQLSERLAEEKAEKEDWKRIAAENLRMAREGIGLVQGQKVEV